MLDRQQITMATMIVTECGFQAWTEAARRAQASTYDMAYLTTFNVQITGSQHSDMFLSGWIVEDVTLLVGFGERGFRSPKAVRMKSERGMNA